MIYIYKKTMYTLSSLLHTYKTHDYTTHDTPELWRGAAGLCARVRACAGAAESSHTYMPIHTTHNTHLQTSTSTTKTHTHTHTQPHPTPPTNLQHVRDTDVCQHQYRKRCAPTREMHCTIYLYTFVYSSYMSCAWPGVCCATSTAAALARRVRR